MKFGQLERQRNATLICILGTSSQAFTTGVKGKIASGVCTFAFLAARLRWVALSPLLGER